MPIKDILERSTRSQWDAVRLKICTIKTVYMMQSKATRKSLASSFLLLTFIYDQIIGKTIADFVQNHLDQLTEDRTTKHCSAGANTYYSIIHSRTKRSLIAY